MTTADEPLTCDVCGVEVVDPWHYSSGENRHLHACDRCWPVVVDLLQDLRRGEILQHAPSQEGSA